MLLTTIAPEALFVHNLSAQFTLSEGYKVVKDVLMP